MNDQDGPTHCRRCRQRLTDPRAILAEAGRVCAEKLGGDAAAVWAPRHVAKAPHDHEPRTPRAPVVRAPSPDDPRAVSLFALAPLPECVCGEPTPTLCADCREPICETDSADRRCADEIACRRRIIVQRDRAETELEIHRRRIAA